MNRFSQIKVFLDEAVHGIVFSGHRAFWRGKTRDQFVSLSVLGLPVVTVGEGANSNIVKALSGTLPGVPRMPPDEPEYQEVPADQIEFIKQWIDDDCPAELSATVTFDADAGGPIPDNQVHNDYWREFDNWATSDDVSNEVFNRAFPLAATWGRFVKGDETEAQLLQQLNQTETTAAIQLLATRMRDSAESHYGNPIPLLTFLDSYELFGRGTANNGLPLDPLRPGAPKHQMNGRSMWFYWCGSIDGCLRLGIQPNFWNGYARAVVLGLLNDGVIRGRFPVAGFDASDPDVGPKMLDHVRGLADSELQAEMAKRFSDSGLTLL